MALPTTTDALVANLMAERIVMRKMFLELKEKTRYFYNVEIEDVPWSERLVVKQLSRKNIPSEFLAKYPFDFKIRFTALGCNMLKCYKHNYNEPCKGKNPTIINGEFFKCQSACYEVFEEFNQFLMEKFELSNVYRKSKNPPMELPFETLSIKDDNDDYCGTQLTELKRFAILPSSRWVDHTAGDDANMILDGELARKYLAKKYRNQPVQRRNMAGLVDSPPLNWNTADQTINFNYSYCKRFVKEYDPATDTCYTAPGRKVAGFLLGDNFVKQFPDLQDLSLENYPFRYLDDQVYGLNGITDINKGYFEDDVTQESIAERTFNNHPDKLVSNIEIVNNTNFFKTSGGRTQAWIFNDNKEDGGIGDILLDMAQNMAIESTAEGVSVVTPKMVGKLIQNKVTPMLIKNTIRLSSFKIPVVTRVASLLIRTQLINLSLKLSLRILIAFSSTASFIFAFGIVTAIADIFLTIYNVGGFNNEVTREMIDEKKRQMINQTIDSVMKDWGQIYIPIIRDPIDDYACPMINPEFLYNLCIINFLQMYPNELENIGNMGISEVEVQNIALEYLSQLTINSAGQTIINYEEYNKTQNDKEVETTISLLETHEKKKRVNTNSYLWKDSDLHLLRIGITCWILSLLLFLFLNIKSRMLTICGLVCFFVWFTFIKLSIQKLNKKKIKIIK